MRGAPGQPGLSRHVRAYLNRGSGVGGNERDGMARVRRADTHATMLAAGASAAAGGAVAKGRRWSRSLEKRSSVETARASWTRATCARGTVTPGTTATAVGQQPGPGHEQLCFPAP